MGGGDERGWRALRQNGDFLRLWTAQSISSVGARITREGLPLTAVLVMHAPAAALGLLAAASAAPGALVGLIGGGFVDRTKRRPLLIVADVGRGATLLFVPLAALTHHLVLAEIYLAAILVGALGNLFDIADHAYLRGLVERRQLLQANAALSATESAAEIGGPAIAGILISLLTAPVALVVNSATYMISAVVLTTIRRPEPRPAAPLQWPRLADGMEGLALAYSAATIRALLLETASSALFGGAFAALYIIYAIDDLGLTPALLGVTIAVGGVGALIGSGLAGGIAARFGVGPALIGCLALSATSAALIPLAGGGRWRASAALMIAQLFGDGFGVAALVYGKSIRQALLPADALGRVGGVFVAVGGLAGVIGALGGGELGELFGARPTLLIACLGLLSSAFWPLASPLRRLRSLEDR